MKSASDHWLYRVVNPGVPWYVALPCNVGAGAAIVLLLVNHDANLLPALTLVGVAAVVLYGTALVRWIRRK